MQHRTLNYRFAEQIFESHEFQQVKWEIFDIVKRAPDLKLATPKAKTKGGKERKRVFVTDQGALNKWFKKEFGDREWEVNPYVTDEKVSQLRADYKKKRVQVEVQFGNMARAIYDVFKMQVSYSQDRIDVGVLIVPMKDFADTIDENIAHFERVARELPYAKMSITLPILVIGIAPKISPQQAEPVK